MDNLEQANKQINKLVNGDQCYTMGIFGWIQSIHKIFLQDTEDTWYTNWMALGMAIGMANEWWMMGQFGTIIDDDQCVSMVALGTNGWCIHT